MSDGRTLLPSGPVTERAVAWGLVAFLLVFYAFPLANRLGLTATEWIGTVAVALATIGAVAITVDEGSLLPGIVLVYAPLAATSLRVVTPSFLSVPYVEELGVALVGAVALGTAAYLVGHSLRLIVADAG